MFKILGIDQSLSASGICLRSQGKQHNQSVNYHFDTGSPPQGVTGDDRFRWFHEWFLGLLASAKPDVLIFEDAASGALGSKDILFELQGVLKMTAYQWKAAAPEMKIYSANISNLKQFATGHGGGDKGPMLEAMKRDFPDVHASNNDEVDAFWLAEVGACTEKLIIPRTPEQIYVAAVVRGDPDAEALKKDMNSAKGKKKRVAAKAAKGAGDVLAI